MQGLRSVGLVLLVLGLVQTRDPEQVEGLDAISGFGARIIHGLFNKPRSLRRIDADPDLSVAGQDGGDSVEARFFLQEKLCSLGLSDCGKSDSLKYVQPVQVRPVGQPLPAQLAGNLPHIPTQIVGADYHPHASYGPQPNPSYNTPSYDSPSYNSPSYPKPLDEYSAPSPYQHSSHQQEQGSLYSAQTSSYEAPKPTYHVPSPSYDAPTVIIGKTSPRPVYTSPKPVYKPNSEHQHQHYATKVDNRDFEKNSETEQTYYPVPATTPRTRISQSNPRPGSSSPPPCSCVPVSQCKTGNIFLTTKQDYSSLVDPRQKAVRNQILANRSNQFKRSRSLKFGEKKEGEESTTESGVTETTLVPDSSDTTTVQTVSETEALVESVTELSVEPVTEKKENLAVNFPSRRRRDSESEPSNKRARLENTFVPEAPEAVTDVTKAATEGSGSETVNAESTTEVGVTEQPDVDTTVQPEATGRDEPFNIESRDTDIDIVSDLKLKLKEERRKDRIKKRKEGAKKGNKKNIDDIPNESEFDEEDFDNKSFDSLSSFTSDVTNQVGSVGNSVTSGVSKIFGDLTNLIGQSTSTGQLQPTVGFSFGLPQYGPGYTGQTINPLGTGGAVNPYFTSPDGLPLGPVNLNPLFSFQTGTNDKGDLAIKPLVNLHLTPNGCGILGCDTAEYNEFGEPTLRKTIKDVLKNPFGFLNDKTSSEYTAPSTNYQGSNSGYQTGLSSNYQTGFNSQLTKDIYGAPSYNTGNNYGAPSYNSGNSYGAPSYNTGDSYGAPSYNTGDSYGAPSYTAPSSGYEAPKPSYTAPKPSYTAPSSGYGAPKDEYMVPSAYVPPKDTGHHDDHQHHDDHESKGQINVHHHYYHTENLLKDSYDDSDEIFKRETVPNSSGTLPANMPAGAVKVQSNSGVVSVQGAGLRFPTSRKVDMENQDSQATRDKRQPEGAHSGHSSNGVHHGERMPHKIDVQESTQKLAAQLTSQEFGSSDSIAPTCGGPGSGYVCCRNY